MVNARGELSRQREQGHQQHRFHGPRGGNPVDSATVCLTKDNDDYRVGTTNSERPGDDSVPRREQRHHRRGGDGASTRKRYEAPSPWAARRYVAINTITIDDDNSGGTIGNGNGIIEAGETVDLGFALKNNGSATTGTVTVILRSSDAGVVVSDSTAGGGTIVASGTRTHDAAAARRGVPMSSSDQHASSVHARDQQEQRHGYVEGHVQEARAPSPTCRWSSCASTTR